MSETIKTLELIRTSISKNIDIAKPYSNSTVLDNFRDDLKDVDRLISNLKQANEASTSHEKALDIDIVSNCGCDDEHICGICHESKGYKVIDGKLTRCS